MRTLRALALATVLTVSSTAAAFAGDGGGYARPTHPTGDAVMNGDGGGYSAPTAPERPAEIQYGEAWA